MSSLKHLEARIKRDETKERQSFYVALILLVLVIGATLMKKSSMPSPYFIFITLETSRDLSVLEKIKLKDEINKTLKFHETTVGLLDDVEVVNIQTEIE